MECKRKMATVLEKQEKALRSMERLIKFIPDARLKRRVERIKYQMGLVPMVEVMDKVPGQTVSSKCRLMGITRQAYYGWINGEYRPSRKQAKQLEKITGINADEISGYADLGEPA